MITFLLVIKETSRANQCRGNVYLLTIHADDSNLTNINGLDLSNKYSLNDYTHRKIFFFTSLVEISLRFGFKN